MVLLAISCKAEKTSAPPISKPVEKIVKLHVKEGHHFTEWTLTADLLTRSDSPDKKYAITNPIVQWKNGGRLTGKKGIISDQEIKIDDSNINLIDYKISASQIIFKRKSKKLIIPKFKLESKKINVTGKELDLMINHKKLVFTQGQGKFVY